MIAGTAGSAGVSASVSNGGSADRAVLTGMRQLCPSAAARCASPQLHSGVGGDSTANAELSEGPAGESGVSVNNAASQGELVAWATPSWPAVGVACGAPCVRCFGRVQHRFISDAFPVHCLI